MSILTSHSLRHDMIGSINAIRLSAEVARGTSDPAEQSEFLDMIDLELIKLGSLVDQATLPPVRASDSSASQKN